LSHRRIGERPRQVVTTTLRPIGLLKRLIEDERTAVPHAATRANAFNLAPDFLETVVNRYHGTQLGGRKSKASASSSAPTRCGSAVRSRPAA